MEIKLVDHTDFIPMFKQKWGGGKSRNYYKCDLRIKNFFFSFLKLYCMEIYRVSRYSKYIFIFFEFQKN